MPGHNVGKSEGPDPDPLPWLAVSEELKAKLMTKPYDAKKSCWVPDKSTGGYLEGLIQSKDGDKVTVKLIDRDEVGLLVIIVDYHLLRLYYKTIHYRCKITSSILFSTGKSLESRPG